MRSFLHAEDSYQDSSWATFKSFTLGQEISSHPLWLIDCRGSTPEGKQPKPEHSSDLWADFILSSSLASLARAVTLLEMHLL